MKEETTQKLPRWGQEVRNKWKINSQIKKPHLKMISIKDEHSLDYNETLGKKNQIRALNDIDNP